jgi:glycosyltransferase involved in cell wall biosynthesis
MKLHYRGLFRSTVSWAQVNRQLAVYLARLGHQVSATDVHGYGGDKAFVLSPELERLIGPPVTDALEIIQDYPLHYRRGTGSTRAGILTYESTQLPPRWAGAIRKHLQHLLVPSKFCRRVMTQSNIPDSMVSIFPLGYDPALFHPQAPPHDLGLGGRFVFLHVAAPHKRKGTRELVRAFVQTFSAREDGALVLKTNFSPRGLPWESADIKSIVAEETHLKRDLPPIVVLDTPEPDTAMPGYYTAARACVQPSYSEGYGLAALEAMACGVPVIVTGWSGVMDFCTRENAYILNYKLIAAQEMQYDFIEGDGQVAQPDPDHLAETLRYVYEHADEAAGKARQALEDNGKLTWENSARELARIVESSMRKL